MSSLCKYSFITINKNDSSPTPTLRKTLNPCNDLLPVKFLQAANFIKRISLLILPRTPVKASMTVETALVLPLFCFFMIHMGSAIEMMRLHGNLEVALWDAGRQVGIYGGILNAGDVGEKEDNDDRLGTVAVSYTYVKNQICNQLGEEYLEQSPLEQEPTAEQHHLQLRLPDSRSFETDFRHVFLHDSEYSFGLYGSQYSHADSFRRQKKFPGFVLQSLI